MEQPQQDKHPITSVSGTTDFFLLKTKQKQESTFI